jgi:signal transduction histidine kinase
MLNAEKIRREPQATREIVVAIDDVTERKRAETALKSAKRHAERANLSKSRYLAAASHDLRQPLQTLSLEYFHRWWNRVGIEGEERLPRARVLVRMTA